MYVTFTKAKKHRVLSNKEIFQLHLYFTLNIAIFCLFNFYKYLYALMIADTGVYNECY